LGNPRLQEIGFAEEAKGHKKKDKDSCKGKNGCNKEGATK
jgi:hypothetical protein